MVGRGCRGGGVGLGELGSATIRWRRSWAPRRESWLGNKEWLDQILQVKYFQQDQRSPEKSPIERLGLGTGPSYWFSVVNEQQSVTSGFPFSPIGSHFRQHKYLLILFPFWFYQVYNPDTLFLLCCSVAFVGPVLLSHNKTAPTLDAMRGCSNCYQLWYEIIWRGRWPTNYLDKLSKEITQRNYPTKLSANLDMKLSETKDDSSKIFWFATDFKLV